MSESKSKKSGFGRGHGPAMGGPKAKHFKSSSRRLMAYLSPYMIQIAVVISFAVGSSIFSIYGPKLLGKVTTKIFEGVMLKLSLPGSGIDFGYINNIIIVLIALYGMSSLLAYIQGYIMSGVSMKVSYTMRTEIIKKMNRMPFKYFDENNHGEVLSRITNDVDTVSQTLNQSMSQIITSFTTVLGVLVMMISISGWMTLVALAIIPISMILVMLIIKQSQTHFKKQQKEIGQVNGHIEEVFSGHIIVKTFNLERSSREAFDQYNTALYQSAWKSQFLSSIMMPLINIVGNIGYVAVCVLGGSLAARKLIEVGDIQAFIQYVRNFTQPIAQLANISNVLQQTVAAAERVFEFVDEEDELEDVEDPVECRSILGAVNFNSVNFGYNDDQTVINNFSVKIQSGQRVAIVGPTGAGKTTIVKLLMRFYDVTSGSITLDGHNIKHFRRKDLRDQFGMVLQDTWLYNASVKDNIRYGNLDATDDDVFAAAHAAHIDSFIHTLPGGYDMILNEEASNISQGQKQLITIARAILSNPKLLILDEATSSVDTRTEMQIQNAMNHLMKDKTSFIIAHRLSTIKDADVILVMNHGDIVESGTHDELLAKNGVYADLYYSQFDVPLTA